MTFLELKEVLINIKDISPTFPEILPLPPVLRPIRSNFEFRSLIIYAYVIDHVTQIGLP